MKINVSCILFLIQICDLNAQEQFSVQLVFKDEIGNSDSIIIGYDENATDSIDIIFGEQNIQGLDWDTSFEVRVTNAQTTRSVYDTVFNPTIQTKKQIVKFICPDIYPNATQSIYIDIMAKHWPISVYWNSSVFNRYCNYNSSIGYNEIADLGFTFSNIASISTQNFFGNHRSYVYYLTPKGDTISPIFWVTFSDSSNTTHFGTMDINQFIIYPNPSSDYIEVSKLKNLLFENFKFSIYGSNGISIRNDVSNSENPVDISDLPPGLYIIRFYNIKGINFTKKFIKTN
jgi:hypothetical protein